MELEDFFLMQKGFFNRRKQDQMQFANLGFCVDAIGSLVTGGKPNYKQFIAAFFGETPKPVDKEAKKTRSQELMKRVKYTTQLLAEKEKVKSKMN